MVTNNATNTSNPITVAQGGTGGASHTAYSVLCGGTTSTGAVQSVASVGTSGQVLTSNGAGALPTFQAASGGIPTIGSSTDKAIVTWNGTTGSAVNNNSSATITAAGAYTNTLQPAFSYWLFNGITNATGDGTTYTILFDQGAYDQASNYNSGTGIFTCPVQGIYYVSLNVCFNNLGAAHTVAIVIIQNTSGFGSVPLAMTLNPYVLQQGTNASVCLHGPMKMQAGGTIYPTIQVQGGTKTVGLLGTALGATFTNFSVTLIS